MIYTYDFYGWYSGQDYPNRVASIAPENESQSTVEGELRANWSGVEWFDMPYVHRAQPVFLEVPESVTTRQAELALRETGYLPEVEELIANIGGDLQIYWRRSQELHRGHRYIEDARIALGLTHQQMDGLFILAATKEP